VKQVTPDILRAAQREHRLLSGMRQRLRLLADHLSLLARKGGPEAEPVDLASADLQCLLTDHLEPAVAGLARLCAELGVEREGGDEGEPS
jgi:hypothetical protein